MPKAMWRIPVIHMNCLVNFLARRKYPHEKTNATQRTKMKRTMVLVFREKVLPASYIPPPLSPLFAEYP